MDTDGRKDDIGKYRVVEKHDSLIATKPKATSCLIGCIALFVLPALSYGILLGSALLGRMTQQTGMLALSLIVFSVAVVLFGLFFGFGRKPILELRRKDDVVLFKGKRIGRITDLVEIVIEFRQIEFGYGSRKVERDQYLVILEPLTKSLPVAFFVKADPAERMARLISNFSGVPFRHKVVKGKSDDDDFDPEESGFKT
jgi:hypothetical protein